MIQYRPDDHLLQEDGFVSDLREELGQGEELVVYLHRLSGRYILAHLMDGWLREYMVLEGWPRLLPHVLDQMRRQFNPDRRFYKAEAAAAERAEKVERDERARKGASVRRVFEIAKTKVPHSQRDHPRYNIPRPPHER